MSPAPPPISFPDLFKGALEHQLRQQTTAAKIPLDQIKRDAATLCVMMTQEADPHHAPLARAVIATPAEALPKIRETAEQIVAATLKKYLAQQTAQ